MAIRETAKSRLSRPLHKDMRDFQTHIDEAPQGTIYCDMDGVLVDIIGGMTSLAGIHRLAPDQFETWLEKNKKKFDAEHPNLFAHLPWMTDGKRLWAYITRYGAHILSAHTKSWQPTSKPDKMAWIKANMSPIPHNIHLVLRKDKQKYAKLNGIPNILIDDYPPNIKEWNAAGGIGILHTSAEDTIQRLKKLGY